MSGVVAGKMSWMNHLYDLGSQLVAIFDNPLKLPHASIFPRILVNFCVAGLLWYILRRLFLSWRHHERYRLHRSFLSQSFLSAFQKPLLLGSAFLGCIWSIMPLKALTSNWLLWVQLKSINLLWLLVMISWTGFRFTGQIEKHWISREANSVEIATARAIAYFIRVAIILGSFVAILSILRIDLSGLLTVGGVSGLVVGLSGRNTIANFLGALSIHFERPFTIGDYIRAPEQKIEGTVEHIGWSLTKIRNAEEIPTLVPNSTFTTIPIENLTRRRHQVINEVIGLRYQDLSNISDIVRDIEKLIREHNDIDNNKPIYARLSKFSASSLDCEIKCYTKVIQTGPYQAVLQDILIRIANTVEAYGASMAYPTQEIYLHQN